MFRRVPLAAVAIVAVALIFTAVPRAQQAWAGLRANWDDLATWTTPVQGAREETVGLGLHLSGRNGSVLLAFIAQVGTARPVRPPSAVSVQIGVGDFANPTLVRTPVLTFLADEDDTEERFAKDASSALVLDDLSPGAQVRNALATVPAADFLHLAQAKTLSANVLGFEVTFRPDQLAAMKKYAEGIRLIR
jgi:hypothetical protein